MKKFIELGERLKKIRGKRNQAVFANELGIALLTYQRYERGERKPPFDILIKIAGIGNVDLQWVATGFSSKEFLDTHKHIKEDEALRDFRLAHEREMVPENIRLEYEHPDFIFTKQILWDIYDQHDKAKWDAINYMLRGLLGYDDTGVTKYE